MWKKSDTPQPSNDYVTPSAAQKVLDERATIGSSVRVKGDLSGEEHLLIQGRVEVGLLWTEMISLSARVVTSKRIYMRSLSALRARCVGTSSAKKRSSYAKRVT